MMLENREATLEEVYGASEAKKERIEKLKNDFHSHFQHDTCEVFSAPGRTEIIGNHTDHNGGKVIAASIDMDTVAAACQNHSDMIRIISEGYDGMIEVNIKEVSKVAHDGGTNALLAGMVEAVDKFGYKAAGFDAYITTNVIRAAGVSSSASFEMVICAILNYFYNDNQISYEMYAKIGQYAENVYWEKASGLMDQMACAVGGAIMLDFAEEGKASYEKANFSFNDHGYQLVIVNTGKGHADLSKDYSDIPMEMRQVAKELGVSRMCETTKERLLQFLTEENGIEKINNDRAILRSLHFLEETRRVEEMEKAAKSGDFQKILSLIDASGKSSWEWLQNCYTNTGYKEQKITLALAMTQLYLEKLGKGVCRVHGGGFAGVIACILPEKDTDEYVKYIGKYVGDENVYPMSIRAVGAVHVK